MELANLSPQQLRKAADLKEKIEALQTQLNELGSAADVEAAEKPKRISRRRAPSAPRRSRVQTGLSRRVSMAPVLTQAERRVPQDKQMTVKAAVLAALESGEAMGKRDIAKRVSVLRRKRTNPDSLNPTLDEMKRKDRTILNPERGIYQLRAE